MQKVKIIGAGLAGTEAAWYLAKNKIKVELYDIKPNKFTPAHKSQNFAELVCSNSLKSNDVYGNAAGLLKEEMRILGSLSIESADKNSVPAGGALAVDRDKFAKYITDKILQNENIEFISKEITDINADEWTIIATGPLTTDALSNTIKEKVGNQLHFFDASAPIVTFESIDMNNAFVGDRYDKGNGDHINCPMNKEQYLQFIEQLTNAERIELHDFESKQVFEGCMPIEIMASRGQDTLRFGPLKPAGLTVPSTGRWAYACLQLRKEDQFGSLYNLIGCQTNLKWGEQKRVFSLIPALENAEFVRYGVMHRNTYINSPEILNQDYSLKNNQKIFFAGQITGVEGYVESAASGIAAAIFCLRKMQNKPFVKIPETTVLGSLTKYISTKNVDFQPMNANFGILPLNDIAIRDKAERKRKQAERSLAEIKQFLKEIE